MSARTKVSDAIVTPGNASAYRRSKSSKVVRRLVRMTISSSPDSGS